MAVCAGMIYVNVVWLEFRNLFREDILQNITVCLIALVVLLCVAYRIMMMHRVSQMPVCNMSHVYLCFEGG